MRRRWTGIVAVTLLALSPVVTAAGATGAPTTLAPADYTFIGLTFLGNRFQVETGRLGETHSADPDVRRYAQLMDTSHVAVENKLVTLLKQIGAEPPPASLLAGAYASLVNLLGSEHGKSFDRDYVSSQVGYQKANDSLYRWELANGSDPRLKAFATDVLPKIDDHLQKALSLSASGH